MKTKTLLRYGIKIVLTFGILALIFAGFQKKLGEKQDLMGALSHHFQHLNYSWLFVALLIFVLTSLVAAYRISLLMNAHRIEIPYRRLLKNLYIGYLFNPLLMGATGGDVVRSYYLMQETSKKAEIVTVLFLDRFVGMVVMALLALASLAVNARAMHLESAFYAVLLVLFFLGACFWMGSSHGIKNRLSRNTRDESRWKRILRQIFETLHHTRGHAKPLLLAALCTLIIQSAMIVSCWLVSFSMQESPLIPLRYFFLFLPIIFTASAIPLSLGGLGVGEAVYAALFALVSVPEVDAITISLLNRIIILAASLIGAFVYLTPGTPAYPADSEDENVDAPGKTH